MRLGLLAAAALVVRVLYVLLLAPTPARAPDDTFWYAFVSDEIVQGHGFVIGHGSLFSPGFRLQPTALHPPLYPLALAGLRELGLSTPKQLLWLGPIAGTLTVIGVGLVGRALAGARVGLVAALIAAFYPLLIVPDGALLSETLYGPALVLVLAAALALVRRPQAGRAALLGAAVGVAALVRSEAIALVVLLCLPLAWRGSGGLARVLRLSVTVVVALLMVAPWAARNEARLGTLALSTNDGVTIGWSNCDSTYHGAKLGYFDPDCVPVPRGSEAHQAAVLRRTGLRYAEHHAGRLPVVLAARLARTWGLFHPFQGSSAVGRNVTVSDIGVLAFYPLAVLAFLGARWLGRDRRRAELWVLLAPALLTSVAALLAFGSLRQRYIAELPLVLLAAIGVAARPLRPAPSLASTPRPGPPDSARPTLCGRSPNRTAPGSEGGSNFGAKVETPGFEPGSAVA